MESLGPGGLSGSSDQFRTNRSSIRGDEFSGCSRDSRSTFALEALAAEDGTSLCGIEGYRGLDTAFGAMSTSLSAGEASCSWTRTRTHACTGTF